MDVKSAFLNGILNKEIYMEQPQGFIAAKQENKVCQLKRALYGLKQASHTWNQQFHGVLTALGFEQTYSDAGIYVHHQHGGNSLLIVVLYVDNITIMGSLLENVKQLKEKLSLSCLTFSSKDPMIVMLSTYKTTMRRLFPPC